MSSIAPLPFTLNDACPITWPAATALMLDYPLIPTLPSEPVVDYVHRVYIEALWLPESIMPLSHLVHSLRRVSTEQHQPASAPTNQEQIDGEGSQQVSPMSLCDMLRPLLLPLRSIETKYQEHLPGLLHDPHAAMERETIGPEESAMWYAWHHGRPPVRHFPDPDHVDEEQWKKQWMMDMERREVLVQILLHYAFLAASSSNKTPSTPERSRKRKRKSLKETPSKQDGKEKEKKKKKQRLSDRGDRSGAPSPSPPPFSVEENLDLLTDRIAIWQTIEEDINKFLKRPGDGDRDWMRVFCEDEVVPLFKDELPELVKAFEEKVVPPSTRPTTPEPDEVMIKPDPKPHRTKPKAVRKPTLTEADLISGRSTIITSKSTSTRSSTPSTTTAASKGNKTRVASLVRSRSISVEPTDGENGRRSRSRSVSLAAEEIKAVGGKRGGIAGNSKIFANEVEMRRQPSGSGRMGLKKTTSTSTVGAGTGGDGNENNISVGGSGHNEAPTMSTAARRKSEPQPKSSSAAMMGGRLDTNPTTTKKITSGAPSKPVTLVAETPPRPKAGKTFLSSTWTALDSSDDDEQQPPQALQAPSVVLVPESPEVVYVGSSTSGGIGGTSRSVERMNMVPETPIKVAKQNAKGKGKGR